ncbi:MAG: quinone-dependent dihydroorotate dehydrogenase [Tenacibaculum sp.]
MYKLLIRPVFFLFEPEKIHHFTFILIKFISSIPWLAQMLKKAYHINDKKLERKLFGLKFKNPVGLAAGFDKNAMIYNQLANFGFGFIEIGTVTPKAQQGNPKKRLFRLKADKAIINRMGLNNKGLVAVIEQLKKNKKKIIIGANIGKNTSTNPKNYTEDYLNCFKSLHLYVDYFALNISCPNVSSDAKLEDINYLKELINKVQKFNNEQKKQKPVFLKIAPNLNNQQLDQIIQLVADTKIEGVIATNTSVDREGLKTAKKKLDSLGSGGLSGNPIKDKSTKVIKYLSNNSNGTFTIIGVGGIHSEKDAIEKLQAGASLIQIYTGLIYEGPGLVKRINKAILAEQKHS